MCKLFSLAVTVSLSALLLTANADPAAHETDQLNQTITATTNQGLLTGHQQQNKNIPFWSEDQKRQAVLEQSYKQAITNNQSEKKNYAYLAGLYLSNNKTSRAIEAYQDAITHDPQNPKLFAAISIAYLHQAKFAMSKAMADEALRLDPSMNQVKTINEYIEAKQTALKVASQVPLDNMHNSVEAMGSPHESIIPNVSRMKAVDKIQDSANK